MNIYEFITPSDAITFKTDDDKVAFTCALLLGNGQAGCRNITTNKSVPSMLMFCVDPQKEIQKFINGSFEEFIKQNKIKISECFNSFAYVTPSERKVYDNACDAITDADKLKQFKQSHENENRTSMNQFVNHAWEMAQQIARN